MADGHHGCCHGRVGYGDHLYLALGVHICCCRHLREGQTKLDTDNMVVNGERTTASAIFIRLRALSLRNFFSFSLQKFSFPFRNLLFLVLLSYFFSTFSNRKLSSVLLGEELWLQIDMNKLV